MKKDNRYWYLLIPIVAIIVAAVFIFIPRQKHRDGDDEEEENAAHSSIERVDDDVIANFVPGPDPAWDGNSPAIRDEVALGVVISADANAFSQPTHVRFTPVHGQLANQVKKTVAEQKGHIQPFAVFELDAGLGSDEVMPGQFTVDVDLEKLQIPEVLWPRLCVCRLGDEGMVQEWNSTVSDSHLSFRSNKNSKWVLGLSIVIGLATDVVGGIVTNVLAKVVFKGATRGSLLGYYMPSADNQPRTAEETYESVIRGDYLNLVVLQVKDPVVGSFFIGFNPYETEMEDPEQYMSDVRSLYELHSTLRDEIGNRYNYRGQMNVTGSWIDGPTYEELTKEAYIQEEMEENEEYKESSNPDLFDPPRSVSNVIKMIRMSNIFLQKEEKLKRPETMCDVFLVGNSFQTEDGKYNNFFDFDPMLTVRYADNYVTTKADTVIRETASGGSRRTLKKTNIINHDITDKLWIDITHELYHHWHACYNPVSAMLRNMRLAESTAAICEYDFASYLRRMRYIGYDPFQYDDDLFVKKDNEEYLAFALDRLIVPTVLNNEDVRSLGSKALTLYKRWWEELAKGIVELKQRMNERSMTNARDWYKSISELVTHICTMQEKGVDKIMKDLMDEKQRQHMHDDAAGIFSQFWTGPNVDAGYMLSKFITYLREHYNPEITLHDILKEERILSLDFAGILYRAFELDDEIDYYHLYEGFVKSIMKDIVEKQDGFSLARQTQFYYADQVIPKMRFNKDSLTLRLKPWGRSGALACRTVKFVGMSVAPYNLCLIPSPTMKEDEQAGVRARLLKEDGSFAAQYHYLPADSNNNQPVTSAAFLFTPHVTEMSLNDNCFYTAVALPKPKGKPDARIVGNKVEVDYNETYPVGLEALTEREITGYDGIVGIAYTVKNKDTEQESTLLFPFTDWANYDQRHRMEIPGVQTGQDMKLSVSCRFYYQPIPNDPTIYYSPMSDVTDTEGEAGEDPTSNVYVNETFKMTLFIDIPLVTDASDFTGRNDDVSQDDIRAAEEMNRILNTTGYLTVRHDGTFTLTVNPINGSVSGSEGGTSASMSVNISGVDVKGRGDLHVQNDRIILDNFDPASLTCTTITKKIKIRGGDFETLESDEKYELSGSGGSLTVFLKGDGRTVDRFELGLNGHHTGVEKSKSGADDPMKTENIDSNDTMTFSGTQ